MYASEPHFGGITDKLKLQMRADVPSFGRAIIDQSTFTEGAYINVNGTVATGDNPTTSGNVYVLRDRFDGSGPYITHNDGGIDHHTDCESEAGQGNDIDRAAQ